MQAKTLLHLVRDAQRRQLEKMSVHDAPSRRLEKVRLPRVGSSGVRDGVWESSFSSLNKKGNPMVTPTLVMGNLNARPAQSSMVTRGRGLEAMLVFGMASSAHETQRLRIPCVDSDTMNGNPAKTDCRDVCSRTQCGACDVSLTHHSSVWDRCNLCPLKASRLG